MYPKPIERLINHFQKLPGIGPKQGARFAFRVLGMSNSEIAEFARDLKDIRARTARCRQCGLSYENDQYDLCPICRNPSRKENLVCVVETERDAYTIERAGAFDGVYHVLGGKVSLKAGGLSPTQLSILEKRLTALSADAEIVLAMSATTEGQTVALHLERALAPLNKRIARLGRGLSSGIEIEYADKDTLADAFRNRQ